MRFAAFLKISTKFHLNVRNSADLCTTFLFATMLQRSRKISKISPKFWFFRKLLFTNICYVLLKSPIFRRNFHGIWLEFHKMLGNCLKTLNVSEFFEIGQNSRRKMCTTSKIMFQKYGLSDTVAGNGCGIVWRLGGHRRRFWGALCLSFFVRNFLKAREAWIAFRELCSILQKKIGLAA